MFVIGVIGCCTHCLGPARAAEAKVTPELVCTVQDAIRWRASAWDSQRCEQVAAALAATPEPDTMAAICVLESDLRPGVVVWHRVPGRDGSASAPRPAGRSGGATFHKAHPGQGRAGARLWAASAGATRHSKLVADAGLCGVRCVLGPGQRCTNWPVRGMTVEQLKDPKTNIAAAARILAKKQRTCGAKAHDCYVGDPDGSKGRSSDVRAIVAAFAGVELPVKKARVRELVRKIAAAVRRGARS